MKTLKEDLDEYMKSYGFDQIENSNKWASASLGTPFKVRFPNLKARKAAVIFHDINHVVTGFKAQTFVGEIQAAYFEVFSGCGKYWFAWFINSLALPFGIFVPHKVFEAIKLAKKVNSNAYYADLDQILAMSTDEVRALWQIDS